jgi:hypothetical protein
MYYNENYYNLPILKLDSCTSLIHGTSYFYSYTPIEIKITSDYHSNQ